MKLFFLLFLLLLPCIPSSAQSTPFADLPMEEKFRRQIALDYTLLDYNVTKPDAKVMGWRLAGILQFLEKNYMQGLYNQKLSSIRASQMEDINYRYLHIDKIQFKHIQKRDSVITIVINMFTKVDKKKKFSNDVTLTFTNSLSDDVRANELFSDIVRYIKRDE